jgi:hypothetical protein
MERTKLQLLKRFALVASGSLMLLVSAPAHAQEKPSAKQAFFMEASDCTAALKARVEERVAQPKSDARNKAILSDTEMGFSFIGVAYKKGLRKPEADQMLAASEKKWATLSKTEQQGRLTTCSAKGQQLLKDLSGFERYIIKNRAQARVDKLLQPKK